MWRTKEVCAIAVRARSEQLDLDHAFEAVAHVPIGLDALAARRILERPVPHPLRLRRDRARLVLAADGDDRIELAIHEVADALRALSRNVDPDLAHRLDRERLHVRRLAARAADVEAIPAHPPQQAFGDLRPRAVVH